MQTRGRILIVDDEADLANGIRDILLLNGYACDAVSDSRAVADIISKNSYDIIVTDYNMPNKDGLEILKDVRANPKTSEIPVIILTADTSDSLIGKLFDHGANDFLRKPVRSIELKARLRSCLSIQSIQNRYRGLITRVLPAPVCDAYMKTGKIETQIYSIVTVGFIDFKDFTLTSELLNPSLLVKALQDYFLEFDRIMKKNDILTIKTIGDAYMFCAGIYTGFSTHAADCIRSSQEVLRVNDSCEHLRKYNWSMRIGLHSGPVIAGVIDGSTVAFDLWGKTVNMAQRLESTATPGTIFVSEETKMLAPEESWNYESLGSFDLKGIGRKSIYAVRPKL